MAFAHPEKAALLAAMSPGSIVTCRNREWVLLPSDQEDLLLLRPLTGATDEVVAVHRGLTDLLGLLVLQPVVANTPSS